ncbi:MAG TPA: O-methyltransferase [bacterium]
MRITNSTINKYLDELVRPRPEIFLELEARAERENFPAIGPQVGALLELLARAISARRAMDLGSGYGYSGLWLARGMAPDGKIILADSREENKIEAQRNFARMGLAKMLDFRVGDAVEIFTKESGPFDLIFNDVDKEDYPKIMDLAFDRLRTGGLLVTDNTLWDGKVTKRRPDETTKAIIEFNRRLAEHEDFPTVQIPLRDGVAVSVKI